MTDVRFHRPLSKGDRGCARCGLIFSSTRAFDLHRQGSYDPGRTCRAVSDLPGIGLELEETSGTWRRPLTEAQQLSIGRLRACNTELGDAEAA
jgi:hypothetical protein